jgi:hypothetical protein
MYLVGPLEYEKDAFYSPTYKWVSCGTDPKHDGQVCYEICYGGNCYFVSDADGRVGLYVSLVDEREKKIDELAEYDDSTVSAIFGVVADCVKGAGGAGVLYGLFTIAVTDPEPITKTLAAGATAVGTIIVCGNSIYDGIKRHNGKERVLQNLEAATYTAIDIFLDIEKNPLE